MATLDSFISINMFNGFNFSALLGGAVTVDTGTEYTVDRGNGTYDQLFGTGLLLGPDAYGRPVVTGTITSYYFGEGDPALPDYFIGLTNISVSFRDVIAAALTATLADDALIVRTAFARNDTIFASDFADVVSGFAGNDSITTYDGNDIVYGDAGNDTVFAGLLNDQVRGDAGNDNLNGQNGNDQLYGGLGLDTLTGGLNNDRFVFDTRPSATNYDRITDFYVPQDTIVLENAVMAVGAVGYLSAAMFWKSVTGLAHDTNDRIIYETDTGWLNYDSNGSAAGGAVHLALLGKNLPLTSNDFVVV
jgi:Ca2+-binding RTX toxin-like protein